jgi:hypothetical protein
MNKQTFYYVVSGVFFLIAIAHLMRGIYEWEAVIAGIIIPVWVSWAAVLIAGYLGYRSYSYGKKL